MNAEEYLNSQYGFITASPHGMQAARNHKREAFTWVEGGGLAYPANSRDHAAKLAHALVAHSIDTNKRFWRKLNFAVSVGPDTATIKVNGKIECDPDRQPDATYWVKVLQSARDNPLRDYY